MAEKNPSRSLVPYKSYMHPALGIVSAAGFCDLGRGLGEPS